MLLQADLHLRQRAALALLAVAGCAGPIDGPALTLPVPTHLTQSALTARITDLTATAELVPAGAAAPLPGVALTASADRRSFSGFLPAEPGDYTLEIVFAGRIDASEPTFLGRWPSAAFTVARGDTVAASFTQPLDTIGRASDGGDTDGDRVGALDELLLGTSRTSTDSDADGVGDADDCFPTSRDRAFAIAAAGSRFDCDGDGFLRLDPPWGAPGQDCDDTAAITSPAARDDCADLVDTDCNPQTCATSDDQPPTITDVTPEATTTVGCFTSIGATVSDASGIVSVTATFDDDPYPMGQARVVVLDDRGNDRWATNPIGPIGYGIRAGDRPITLRATDGRGNTGVLRASVRFSFDGPTITAFRPAIFGVLTAPIDVTVEGTFVHGPGTIALESRTRGTSLTYDRPTARVIGSQMGTSATFRVDPSMLGPGTTLIYPVLTDAIGNVLAPTDNTSPIGDHVTGFVACTGATPDVPAGLTDGPDSPFRPAKTSDVVARSVAAMRAFGADYRLTFLNGSPMRGDGRVVLDVSTDYLSSWYLIFHDATRNRFGVVRWSSIASGRASPEVIDDDRSASETAVIDHAQLADSDAILAAYQRAPGCPMISGAVTVNIIYHHVGAEDVVDVTASTGESWRGTARSPVMTISDCR